MSYFKMTKWTIKILGGSKDVWMLQYNKVLAYYKAIWQNWDKNGKCKADNGIKTDMTFWWYGLYIDFHFNGHK